MLDVHCHLLPGLDDGARSIEESIRMLSGLTDEGLTHVVATPHFYPGKFTPPVEKIDAALTALKEAAVRAKVAVEILRGRECYFDFELTAHAEKETFAFTWKGKRYQLIELPLLAPPPALANYVASLQRNRITPILAHAERYAWLLKDAGRIGEFRDMGFKIQVDVMSFSKKANPVQRAGALKLLEAERFDLLASDLHRPGQIEIFKEGLAFAGSLIGKEKLAGYFDLL